MMPNCGVCTNPIKPGQAVVGMPVIRITDVNKSQMAGGELIFHVSCFLRKMKEPKLELVTK